MSHHKTTICVLSPHEAEELQRGEALDHKHHQHISPAQACLMTNGSQNPNFRYVDDAFTRTGQVSEPWGAVAKWAELGDGSFSGKHLVLLRARSWQVIGSTWQFAPLGHSAPQKHGRTHLRGPRAPRCRVLRQEETACPIPTSNSSS